MKKKIYENMESLEEWGVCGTFAKRNGGNAGDGIFYISGSAKENSGTFGTLEKQCRFLKAERKKGS